jgi:hypothetical protein
VITLKMTLKSFCLYWPLWAFCVAVGLLLFKVQV